MTRKQLRGETIDYSRKHVLAFLCLGSTAFFTGCSTSNTDAPKDNMNLNVQQLADSSEGDKAKVESNLYKFCYTDGEDTEEVLTADLTKTTLKFADEFNVYKNEDNSYFIVSGNSLVQLVADANNSYLPICDGDVIYVYNNTCGYAISKTGTEPGPKIEEHLNKAKTDTEAPVVYNNDYTKCSTIKTTTVETVSTVESTMLDTTSILDSLGISYKVGSDRLTVERYNYVENKPQTVYLALVPKGAYVKDTFSNGQVGSAPSTGTNLEFAGSYKEGDIIYTDITALINILGISIIQDGNGYIIHENSGIYLTPAEYDGLVPAENSSSPNSEEPAVTTTTGSSNSSGFQGHRVKLSQDNFTNSGGSTSNGTYNPADYNDLYATSSSDIHQRADGVWVMDMGPNRDMDKEIEGFKREGGYEILLELGVRIPCTQDPYINASNLAKVLNAKDRAQYGRDIWTVSSDGMRCKNTILDKDIVYSDNCKRYLEADKATENYEELYNICYNEAVTYCNNHGWDFSKYSYDEIYELQCLEPCRMYIPGTNSIIFDPETGIDTVNTQWDTRFDTLLDHVHASIGFSEYEIY